MDEATVDESALPTGTVTFFFSDIEGSTRLATELAERWPATLNEHRRRMRTAFAQHGGREVGTEGDSFFVVFARASDAVACALDAQIALAAGTWPEDTPVRVRMGIHSGEAVVDGRSYAGVAVHEAARVMAAAHGGQVYVSGATATVMADRLPEGADFADLGVHRLKDIANPCQLYELIHPALPAHPGRPRTMTAHPNNLPAPLTSFVGRDRETCRVAEVLDGARMVTLTGAGGVGKTRIALEVATQALDRFPDGVWLVDLAPLADGRLIDQAVAAAVGVAEQRGQSLADSVVVHLGRKRVLLVFDNCEHLLDSVAPTIARLVQHAPNVRVLATSREPVGIVGETTWRVPSLPIPPPDTVDVEHLLDFAAVQLFLDRAALHSTTFALSAGNAEAVAAICSRLDGIPLAIELAAAKVRMMPVEQIADRIDDHLRLLTGGSRVGVERQQTLRATIDWSHNLLTEAERTLFRRVGAFAGGFALDAGEAVCASEPLQSLDIAELLGQLVDKSLVVFDQESGRYRLLESLRQYANERLAAAGEAEAVRTAHRDAFLALAEREFPRLTGPEAQQSLATIDNEHQNLRAALEWSRTVGDYESGLRIATCISRFWATRGHLAEGRRWLEEFLSRSSDSPVALRAKIALAGLGWRQGEFAAARAVAAEAVELARASDERAALGHALHALGNIVADQDGLHAAVPIWNEALEIRRAAGDDLAAMMLLNNLAIAALADDPDHAEALYHEVAEFGRKEYEFILPSTLTNLAWLARARCDFDAMDAYMSEAQEYAERFNDSREMAATRMLFAWMSIARGELNQASAHLDEILRLSESAGELATAATARRAAGLIALDRGESAHAEKLFANVAVVARSQGVQDLLARALCGLTLAYRHQGRSDDAGAALDEAIEIAKTFALKDDEAEAEALRALLACDRGDTHAAFAASERALALGVHPDARQSALLAAATAARTAGNPARALSLHKQRLDHVRNHQMRLEVPRSLDPLVGVSAELVPPQYERGVRIAAAADALRAAMGTVRPLIDQAAFDRGLGALREHLGAEPFEAEWVVGLSLSPDDAVDEALSLLGDEDREN